MNQPWLREEWYSSPLTFASEVQSQLHFPEKVEILDLTLDENGEGMAGARMTEEQKLVVARQLDEMGVHRIGVLGYPARVTPQEIEQMKENVAAAAAICRTLKKARPTALASTLEDIDRAAVRRQGLRSIDEQLAVWRPDKCHVVQRDFRGDFEVEAPDVQESVGARRPRAGPNVFDMHRNVL